MPDGSFDPSIIANAGQIGQQNSPNALLQGYTATAGNLLNVQKLLSQRAAGQDFQASIDPATGQPVVSKLNRLLAADPRAAFDAIDASQAGQQNQSTQLANQQQQIANSLKRIQVEGDLATNYAQNPPSRKEVLSDLTGLIQDGVVDPSTAAQMASDPPFDAPLSVQQAYWKNHAATYAAAAGAVNRFLPTPQTVDTGSGAQVVDANPRSNPGIIGTNINYGLTPDQQVSTGAVALPGGGTQVGTLPQLARVVGGTVPQGSVTPGGAAPPAPAPNGSFGQPIPDVNAGPGRIYPGPGPAQSPSGGPGGAPAPAQPPPSATGLNIPAGTTQIAQNDTDYFTNALGQQQAAAATLPALRNVLAAAPGADTGPAAADIASIGSVLSEFGIPIGASQAEQEQNLTKNGVQLVAALASKLGTPTDGKMMEAAMGSPNSSLTEGAIRTIGAEMTGTASLANATANALQAARAQGITPGTTTFAALRSALNNPMLGTAFQFPYLDPAARGRVITALGGIKSPEAQHLLQQLNFAYQLEPDLPRLNGGN